MSSSSPLSLDVSDENALLAARELVDDRFSMNWIATGCNELNLTRLKVFHVGYDGFTELKQRMSDWSSRVVYGGFVVHGFNLDVNNSTINRRSKVIGYCFIGADATETQRIESCTHQYSQVLFRLFHAPHLTIEISGKDFETSFTEEAVATKLHESLLTASRRTKSTGYAFGGPEGGEPQGRLRGKRVFVKEVKKQRKELEENDDDVLTQ